MHYWLSVASHPLFNPLNLPMEKNVFAGQKHPYTCIGIMYMYMYMYMYMHTAQYTCICMYLTVIQTKNSYETGFSIKA